MQVSKLLLQLLQYYIFPFVRGLKQVGEKKIFTYFVNILKI